MAETRFLRCKESGKVLALLVDADTACSADCFEVLEAGSVDAATEKHVPVVERNGNQISVRVGSVEHPMTEAHYIQFIALATDKTLEVHHLTPEDKPETSFELPEGVSATVYEYCNLHGLWKTEL